MKKEYTISTYLLESQRLKKQIHQIEEYIDTFSDTYQTQIKLLNILDKNHLRFLQKILLLSKDFKSAKYLLAAKAQKNMLEEEYKKNKEILFLQAQKFYEIEKAHNLSVHSTKTK